MWNASNALAICRAVFTTAAGRRSHHNVQSEAFSVMFSEDVWADGAAPGSQPMPYKFTQLIL